MAKRPDIWTTYSKCRDAGACKSELYRAARKAGGIGEYGKDNKTSLIKVLDTLGLDSTIWVLDCAAEGADAHRIKHQFAADCAARVLAIFEREYPNDARPRDAIKSTRRYALGRETWLKWTAARGDAEYAYLYIAGAAYAAKAAARADAASASVDATWAVVMAGGDIPRNATSDTETSWQEKQLRKYLEGTARSVRLLRKRKT